MLELQFTGLFITAVAIILVSYLQSKSVFRESNLSQRSIYKRSNYLETDIVIGL